MKKIGLFFFLLGFSIIVNADLALDGTRVILYHSDREASFNIKNDGNYPVIIQTWVDDGNPENTPETITNVPALSLPSVLQLKSNESHILRIINKFTPTDKNKETLYWLNLYEITPKPINKKEDSNLINIVVRLQIKVFYRPDNLIMNISEVSQSLLFTKKDKLLIIENPTPFYITMQSATGENNPTISIPMLAPFSTQHVELENSQINQIDYALIDDFGMVFKDKRILK